MKDIRCHRDLIVWQKSMDLTVYVYESTKAFPPTEIYGITSQLRRAAASVPANIAEGSARGTAKDYAHFLSVARGSLVETETFLLLAIRLDYMTKDEATLLLDLVSEIGKMLTALRNKLVG